ncbi:hypothetical protein [Acidithiobacillus albertensis]|uniref:hypothetical protein n=1 Tax=Acidithiobacillus albertensis TaxID=119978 RepID=UPI001C0747A5|nr:hypothetical protein [Acidithiobacillus albertensis]MBU2741553.1 hypothetical protein [Acidithiobacillus albertensis]
MFPERFYRAVDGFRRYTSRPITDWNFDEDRSRVRTGFGPENLTPLRRFAIGILKSLQKPTQSIAEMMRTLCFRTRLVFDYLRMTKNSAPVMPGGG